MRDQGYYMRRMISIARAIYLSACEDNGATEAEGKALWRASDERAYLLKVYASAQALGGRP